MATGMGIARALMAQERPPGIAEALDFNLLSVEEGSVTVGGTPGRYALNPMGFVHGGYISTLLDTACGLSVLTRLGDGQAYTSIDLQVAFHKGIRLDAGAVRAVGHVVSLGRRVAFARADLFDAEDRLLASATSSLLIFEEP